MPGKSKTKKTYSKKFKCRQTRLAKKKLAFLKLAVSIFENKNASSTPDEDKSSKSNLEVPSCEIDKNEEEEIIYEEVVDYFLEETSNVDNSEDLTELNQSNGLDQCTQEKLIIKIDPTEYLSELNQSDDLVHCAEEKEEQSVDNDSSKTTHTLNLSKLNKFSSNDEVKYNAVIILSHDLDYYSAEEEEEEEEIPTFNSDEIDKNIKHNA
ncbi:uncharacterized protein LOC141529589 [Cotesia typhae]|uniref:uncharacterized protein LOC141529589 n=1 Tax=Cotesia typhae TaxID=2053667 RepID=UPI003D692F32